MSGTSDYKALTESAAWIDLSDRGRLCLIGADRQRFLNGQVTNNIKDLRPGQGCYAALANAKGKMTTDLFIYVLQDEILLDFEPGLKDKVTERLEKYIIADDVQIVDASSSFGLITVCGPAVNSDQNSKSFTIREENGTYIANTFRFGLPARDYFFSIGQPPAIQSAQGSREAFDTVRIEQGIPKFGVDMDENTLVPEAIEHAISYNKGCYIGQEVIARIRTYGQVAKALRGLRFESGAQTAARGDKIFQGEKEVGFVTSAVFSPKLNCPIALGYVRKECHAIGTNLVINGARVEIVALPFQP